MTKDDVKILLLDIETVPDLVWAWSLWDARALEVKEHWKIISFAASWYGSARTVCKILPDYEGVEALLVGDIYEMLDEADVVVAHHGSKFDIPKINAKLIEYGFAPPSPYKIVDTKKEVARVAKFSSNKLDWLAKQLGFTSKVEHNGWPLWRGCIEGDRKAWELMRRYNKQDIGTLRELFETLTPWIRMPNFSRGTLTCTNTVCKSTDIQQRGYYHAKTRTYKKYVCNVCGKWSRAVTSEKFDKALVTELS